MQQAQINEIKALLESFLKIFDEYKDEICSDKPQRGRLNELRRQLQLKEPQITRHVLNIIGNGSVVIRSYASQATLSYASLLATALMGGNNELKHNFRDFYGPVTLLLNRSIGTIEEGQLQGKETGVSNGTTVKNRKAVFVVHGRNEKAREAMFTFLRSINLEPIEWIEAIKLTGKPSPYIGEVLDIAFSQACAIVVVFTGDDLARLGTRFTEKGEEDEPITPQARPNVIFEAGLALGRSPDRTVLVQLGELRDMSDLAGRHIIKLSDNSVKKRQDLANRLRTAGCDVRIEDRTDWHEAGDFKNAITYPDNQNSGSVQNSKTRHDTASLSKDKELFNKIESIMPNFLAEMRNDLKENPVSREFILLKKAWTYNSQGNQLVYYYDD